MRPKALLRSFIDGFFENTSVNQLAGACALGVAAGILPKANLLAKLLGLAMVVLRVNLAAALLVAAVFTLLGPLFHFIAHPLGLWLLTAPALRGMWTALYNTPLVPWTAFNDTVVLGSLLLGMVLFVPSFMFARRLIAAYRAEAAARFFALPVVRSASNSRLLRWYLD